jgi:hypothetical protein
MEPAAHKSLHIVIILLATLLALLSILAYRRIGNRRFLLICLAFFLFAVREFIIFSEVVFSYRLDILIPLVKAPVSHVLSLLILLLFFLGVLWREVR